MELREGRDEDSRELVALLGAVFDEYPGCVLDVEGEMPELLRIASWFREHEGAFWVAVEGDGVVGCIGFTPAPDAAGIELKKLYVSKTARETGLGSTLVRLVERAAAERRARFIELWSDTRFVTAHRFYEARGYARTERTRELHDKSETVEYHFVKQLAEA